MFQQHWQCGIKLHTFIRKLTSNPNCDFGIFILFNICNNVFSSKEQRRTQISLIPTIVLGHNRQMLLHKSVHYWKLTKVVIFIKQKNQHIFRKQRKPTHQNREISLIRN